VKDRRIQSTGYNGTPPGKAHCEHTEDTPCEIAIHAEENALTWANEARGGTLYSTHAPCGDCAALIQMDEIERVVYKDKYRSLSGIISLKLAGIEVVQL
jgi:dCMP deaminase